MSEVIIHVPVNIPMPVENAFMDYMSTLPPNSWNFETKDLYTAVIFKDPADAITFKLKFGL